jgi:hypothetical protein
MLRHVEQEPACKLVSYCMYVPCQWEKFDVWCMNDLDQCDLLLRVALRGTVDATQE